MSEFKKGDLCVALSNYGSQRFARVEQTVIVEEDGIVGGSVITVKILSPSDDQRETGYLIYTRDLRKL